MKDTFTAEQKDIQLKQNLWSLLIIIVCIVFVYLITPKYQFVPHGLASSLGEYYPPTSESQVKIYETMPADATPVGTISGELAAISTHTDQKQVLIDFAKKEAASLGATGLIITALASQGRVLMIQGVALRD